MPLEQKQDAEKNLDVSRDALGDSSSSTETSEQDANAGQTMKDFIQKSLEARGDKVVQDKAQTDAVESDEEAQEAPESSSVTEKDSKSSEAADDTAEKGEDQEKEAETDKDEPEESESDEQVEPEKPVPYERFKEVNERAKQAEAAFKSVEQEVRNFRGLTSFCERNQISVQQFHDTLELLAAINNGDIEKVAPQINKWHEQLQSINGEKLPADIQAKVDEGLDLEIARQWAKDRVKAQLVESRGKKSYEQLQREQEEHFQQSIEDASNEWVNGKMSSDPDFKEGSLKWDEVQDRYQHLLNTRNEQGRFVHLVKNARDLVTLLDRAYNDVNERIKKRNGNKPATKKRLPGDTTLGTKSKVRFEDAETLEEAVKIGMKERGHTFI